MNQAIRTFLGMTGQFVHCQGVTRQSLQTWQSQGVMWVRHLWLQRSQRPRKIARNQSIMAKSIAWLAFGVCSLFVGPVYGAASFVVDTTPWNGGASADSSIDVTGSDRLLVCMSGDEGVDHGSTQALSAWTVGGQSLTFVTANTDSTVVHQEIWTADETALSALTGSQTLSATGDDGSWQHYCALFAGVNDDTLQDSAASLVNSTSPVSVTLDHTTDDLVVLVFFDRGEEDVATWSDSLIEIVDINAGGGLTCGVASNCTVAGAYKIETATTVGNQYDATGSTSFNRGWLWGGVFAPVVSDSTPPVYTVAPAVASKDATSVTFSGTATDDTGPIDHYFAVYADGSTPTAANVKGAAGTGFVTSSNDSDLNVTSGVAASVTSGANLTASTAYEGCMVAEDNLGNLQASATCVGFTTNAAIADVPLLVQDAFTGTGTVAGRTPDVNAPGNTWAIVDIWTGQSAGTATLQSNSLELADQTAVVIDVGTADMTVDVNYVFETGGNIGIPMRYVDASNWWKCQYISNNTVRLQKRVSDVTTNFTPVSYTYTPGQSYRLTAYAHGNDIGCAIDGVHKVLVTDPALNTATKGGVSADADTTGPRFDDIAITQPFDGAGANGEYSYGPKSLFFSAQVTDCSFFWVHPGDLPDQTNVDFRFYDGGDYYIDPETDLAGETQWSVERFCASESQIRTTSHTHTTIETTPGTAPVFNDVDCALKTNAYELNVNPGPVDYSQCLTEIGIPQPTFSWGAGSPTGRILDLETGVESGTPTDTAGSPYSYTITATNATGSDTLAVVSTVTAQAGNAPVCGIFPTYYVEVGDSVSLDMSEHCSNATSYSCGTLATGLTRTGATIAGVVTTAEFRETNCTVSNSAGSTLRTWRVEVWPSGSLCPGAPQTTRATRNPISPTHKPVHAPITPPHCTQF